MHMLLNGSLNGINNRIEIVFFMYRNTVEKFT